MHWKEVEILSDVYISTFVIFSYCINMFIFVILMGNYCVFVCKALVWTCVTTGVSPIESMKSVHSWCRSSSWPDLQSFYVEGLCVSLKYLYALLFNTPRSLLQIYDKIQKLEFKRHFIQMVQHNK